MIEEFLAFLLSPLYCSINIIEGHCFDLDSYTGSQQLTKNQNTVIHTKDPHHQTETKLLFDLEKLREVKGPVLLSMTMKFTLFNPYQKSNRIINQ